jgi:hypothetical protein
MTAPFAGAAEAALSPDSPTAAPIKRAIVILRIVSSGLMIPNLTLVARESSNLF